MSKPEVITYKFPGGMKPDGTGIILKVLFTINQKVKKNEILAIFSSANFEMEMTAEKDGLVTEIFVEENEIVKQNQTMWNIKTTHNKNYI